MNAVVRMKLLNEPGRRNSKGGRKSTMLLLEYPISRQRANPQTLRSPSPCEFIFEKRKSHTSFSRGIIPSRRQKPLSLSLSLLRIFSADVLQTTGYFCARASLSFYCFFRRKPAVYFRFDTLRCVMENPSV